MPRTLDGKTVIVTGGSSGIGAAAARLLRQQNAHVVITGRSEETQRIAQELGCDAHLVDYASFDQVRRLAGTLLDAYPRIDVLVNNAGGIFSRRQLTRDGREWTLQVNHLSGFLLTALLQARLEASRAVVINTSSMVNLQGHIDFTDLDSERRYVPLSVYGTTKLMNLLHAMEIGHRFQGVSAVSFHPGAVATGFAREGGAMMRLLFHSPLRHMLMSPDRAAQRLVSLAAGEPGQDWIPGEYYDNGKPGRRNAQATPEYARKLWDASERLIEQSSPERGPVG